MSGAALTPVKTVSPVETMLRRAYDAGHAALDEATAKSLLAELGIRTPKGLRLSATPELAGADLGLKAPFVLKALSNEALHKSEVGAVRLGLADVSAVAEASRLISASMASAGKTASGFLVEEMAAPGFEIVIGGTTDPQFGPMIMVGAGGIFAEILKDVSFRLCPINAQDARAMLDELQIAPILKGARGRPAADIDSIVTALLALGGAGGFFLSHADKVVEFDLNPLIARADGLTAVDCRIVLKQSAQHQAEKTSVATQSFAPLFKPHSIAVVGASATGTSAGNRFIRVLKAQGFAGTILPIHPSATEIEGIAAYPSFAAIPGQADYAYLTVPAERVEAVLSQAKGKVRFVQVMASGDPETHLEWERRLTQLARQGGFRLIGPNCMGTHSPHGRYTFMEGVSVEAGQVGIACQSGGLGMDILRRGENLGLRFSGLVTLGNSVDVEPTDLLEYFLEDAGTRVIGLYVEDIKDGRRFLDLARRSKGIKPMVVLIGGVTSLGQAAAASHTGALASSDRAWRALAKQTGIILTETLDEFLDALQLCLWLKPKPALDDATVTLFGNGGGTSVLATDALERAGFLLAKPSAAAQSEYAEVKLPPGASLANPIDLPASVLKEEEGKVTARILNIDRQLTRPYATIVHLNLPVISGYRHVQGFLPNLVDSVLGGTEAAEGSSHRILVLRTDRGEEADGWRREFRGLAARRSVPTFDEIPQAIRALRTFRAYEEFMTATGAFKALPKAGQANNRERT